jgi:hypothetical protein
VATYYADAVNGNDTNDGLSWATAKATIPAVLSLQSSGAHTLWLRNTFTISANVTFNSASWSIRGESPASAGITLTAQWQSAGNAVPRHYFHNLTLTPQIDAAFPQSPAMFNKCVINGTTFNWNSQYRAIQLIDCVITSTSNSTGMSNAIARMQGCTFVSMRIVTANNALSVISNCCFRDCVVTLNQETLLTHCSFWKTRINDGNVQSFYRNCVFAYDSGLIIVPQFQFNFSCYYMSGNVAWNTVTNATTPAYLEYNAATVLSSNPFIDPDNDDFRPTPALLLVTGENGQVPGAKVTTASGGGFRAVNIRGGVDQ